jgi:hypothetical protein
METTKESPLILGRPFLSTTGAHDVAGEIRFNINDKEEKFDFWPRQEQCSMIHIKYELNPQGIKEVKFNLNWWMASSRKTKKIKGGWSQIRTTQRKRKKLQGLFPHHQKRTKRCGNKKMKLRSPPPQYPSQTKWCGD